MIKRILIGAGILIGAALTLFFTFAPAYVDKGRNVVADHSAHPVSDRAAALHGTLVVGDWHADSLLWKRDLTKRSKRGQLDIPRMVEGNVALQVFAAVTKSPAGQNYNSNSADATDNITLLAVGQMWPPRTWTSLYQRAIYQSEKLQGFAAKVPDQLVIIRTKSDLEALLSARAQGAKTVGGILGIEGSHALDAKLENLDGLFDAGYRVISLQHFFDNALGGSLHGESNLGLTDFGRQVTAKLAQGGFILDVSHSSPQVVRDVLDSVTDVPVVLSHTGLHSACPVKRNIDDALMVDIAKTGGVIAIGYWADAVCDASPAGIAKSIKAAVDLLGEDHVSLGSDFDGSVATEIDTSELAALTHALIQIGLTDTQIRKVMGDNMVRILRQRLPD